MTLLWATTFFSFGIIIGIAIGAFVARYPKEAIVSLHEWNVVKDKRIAELELKLQMAESYRLNYEHATKIDREDYEQRIADLERQLAEAKEDTADLDWL